jgi:anti-anti-sigma factor
MEITAQDIGDVLELRVKGELDNYWAGHLAARLDDVIRNDSHRVKLDLSEVTYLSSAGIGILVKYYKQLRGIQGFLTICKPSDTVKQMLSLTKLDGLLISQVSLAAPPAGAAPRSRRCERDGLAMEVFDIAPGSTLVCRTVGNPDLLHGCRFADCDCHSVKFPADRFGIGLGAFGMGFADTRDQFGEFLAAAGAAVCLPTHENQVPDYHLATGSFVPELKLLYGLVCEGAISKLARFESKTERGTASLTALVEFAFDECGAETVGMVMVAETAGLIGAALRRSPALKQVEGAPLRFPAIRDWLSFTPERAFPHCLALVVGIATRADPTPLAPLIRPLGPNPFPAGHFHAAVFSYRPIKKGKIRLNDIVSTLIETQDLKAVLHLVNDHRSISGAGQSEFVRGACWIGPIGEIQPEVK